MLRKWLSRSRAGVFSGPKSGLHLIRDVRDSDTFVCSFPKSGNTYLRFIMANALTAEPVHFKNINQFVPGIYTQASLIDKMPSPRYIKIHEPLYSIFPRSISIVRDLREVVISYYHYQLGTGEFKGSIHEFISDQQYQKPFGSWNKFVLATKEADDRPSNMVIRFEDLIENSADIIPEILTFLNIDSHRSINEIVKNTSFSALKSVEKSEGNVFDSDVTFFRSGKRNSYTEELSTEQIKRLTEENYDGLKAFGYEV